MVNISGFGTSIRIVALQSFPVGLNISSLSDDQDSLIIEEVESVGYQLTYDAAFAYTTKPPSFAYPLRSFQTLKMT